MPYCAPHLSLAEAVVIVTVREASLLSQTPASVSSETVAIEVGDDIGEDEVVAGGSSA